MSRDDLKKKHLGGIDDAIRDANVIIEIGDDSMTELERQKKVLLDAQDQVLYIDGTANNAGSIIRNIKINIMHKKMIAIIVIIFLFVIIGVLLYFRFRPIEHQ